MGSLHLENDLLEDNQPFPTLQLAMESLDPHVGFNIEIKWTMQLLVRVAGLRNFKLEDLLPPFQIGIIRFSKIIKLFW